MSRSFARFAYQQLIVSLALTGLLASQSSNTWAQPPPPPPPLPQSPPPPPPPPTAATPTTAAPEPAPGPTVVQQSPPPPAPLPPPPPPPPPPPVVEGPPAEQPRTPIRAAKRSPHYQHDGFFLELAPGLQYHRARITNRFASQPYEATITGVSSSFTMSLGGAAFPGFIIGATFGFANDRPENSLPAQGTISYRMQQVHAALMLRYYPDARRGFYVEGQVGTSDVTFDRSVALAGPTPATTTSTTNTKFTGMGFAAGLGYQFFVSQEWSVGAGFQFLYMDSTERNPTGSTEDLSLWHSQFRINFTYN